MSDGKPTRYTVRFRCMPGGGYSEYAVVTSRGELKAVAMAASEHSQSGPEEAITDVEIVQAEGDFLPNSPGDLRDYWEMA